MYEGWMRLAGVEFANHTRLQAYLEGGMVPPGWELSACACPTLTPDLLGDGPYTAPEADPAPWWNPHVPASEEFAGLLVLSVTGLDDNPTTRRVTGRVTGGAALGSVRQRHRSIVVTGVLLGTTCCGVSYGRKWLSRVLRGCGHPGCSGDDLEVLDCCPDVVVDDPELFLAEHRRTLRRVALTDGPSVIARDGDGCGSGCSADMLTVEFTLTAATPWAWTEPAPLLEVGVPAGAAGDCIQWCVHTEGSPCTDCRLAACDDPGAVCGDPRCRTPAPPQALQPPTCYCQPYATEHECYEVDLPPEFADGEMAPIITLHAGSSDLHRVTVTTYEMSGDLDGVECGQAHEVGRCTPHSVYHAGFVPAGGTLTFDGQVGAAVVECNGVSEQSGDAWGAGGAPPSWRTMGCDHRYCVCVEADVAGVIPAADATVQVAVSGRE